MERHELEEQDHLEIACRLVYIKVDGTCMLSDIPKMKNTKGMIAMDCFREVEFYDNQIKRFKEAAAELSAEFEAASQSGSLNSQGDGLRTEYQENIQTIIRGQSILEKRRRVFARRVNWAKLQFLVAEKAALDAKKLNEEAQVIFGEISQYRIATNAAVQRFNQLESRFGETLRKFNAVNLDQERINTLTFNHRMPENVLNFIKGYPG